MPKDNRKNKRYNSEEKEAMLEKLLPPNSISLSMLSVQTGIPASTLHTWKSKALNAANTNGRTTKKITVKDKLNFVLESYKLTEIELSKYCRKNGIYVNQVKKWRSNFEGSLEKDSVNIKDIKEELFETKKKNNTLKKELRRKEKALAEAAVLLVLQKKFQAFMEEEEN